jgi:N-acetylneuraminic acid mutarotase
MTLRVSFVAMACASLAAAFPSPPQSHGKWQTLAPITVAPRQEHVTVAISQEQLVIIGGVVPSDQGYSTTDIVQVYDIDSDSWSSAAPLPTALNHPNGAVVNGKIYVLGGLTPLVNATTWQAIPDSWAYDPATGAWTPREPMPLEMESGSAAMGVYRDTIFLAGGMRSLTLVPGGLQDTVDTVVAYNTTSDAWIQLPALATHMPEGRDHAGAAVVGHVFYVLGGRRRGQYNVADTVFALDLEDLDKGWVTKAGRMPTARGGVAASTIGELVYTLGGEGNPAEGARGVFSEVEAYNTTSDSWERLPPMAVPRHGTSAVAVGRQIFVPGGGDAEGGAAMDVMDVYRPKLAC